MPMRHDTLTREPPWLLLVPLSWSPTHALKCVPLEQALGRYVKVDSQGNVTQVNGYFEAVRPDNVEESKLTVAWIKNNYFNGIEIREAVAPGVPISSTQNVSVNLTQIIGYYSPEDSDSMICSELYNRAYFGVFKNLPLGVTRYHYKTLEVRISPQDDYNARNKYGKLLSDIVSGK